ncbi:hypothetical protein K4H28_04805 [Deefgea tanakiae]|uniref:Uncharacterized protein n=1 Tax=Deefgea tanakiae TaxID=2865840 RepID=A0ABX8Z844_9NEIS|nr:hypothetical protein [Deefgea tanakiae]QZA78731.1 hypothetical protein K4H28_04805 [Deefgea tanakiae]
MDKVNENMIDIGGIRFNGLDIKKYWVDSESAEEKKIRYYYQDNHYLGSVFSLLIAGLVSTFLSRRKNKPPRKKYLHIRTRQNVAYSFSEDEININDTVLKLKT